MAPYLLDSYKPQRFCLGCQIKRHELCYQSIFDWLNKYFENGSLVENFMGNAKCFSRELGKTNSRNSWEIGNSQEQGLPQRIHGQEFKNEYKY